MKIVGTGIADEPVIKPKVFGDDRGFFYESLNARNFHAASKLTPDFVRGSFYELNTFANASRMRRTSALDSSG